MSFTYIKACFLWKRELRNILYIVSHKSFPIHYNLWEVGKFLKSIVTHLYSTKYIEINICHSFRPTKVCFVYRIIQEISDILWTMLGNGWKCILNSVHDLFPSSYIYNALGILSKNIIQSYSEAIEYFTYY